MNRLFTTFQKLHFNKLSSILNRYVSTSSIVCKRHELFNTRQELFNADRVVVKLGSAVITRQDGCGIALGRLASIVEQISQLQNSGKKIILVTSGAVAFGKQKLSEEIMMSKSLRQAVGEKIKWDSYDIDPRACAASGQSGLMALYGAMFSQYGIKTGQVLVNKVDFYNEYTRENLQSTLNELLELNIIPILNTNDAIASKPGKDLEVKGMININDNDSLAARLAVLVESDLLIIMSDVNGLYDKPPTESDSHLMHTFNPKMKDGSIEFGVKSNVGTGGMESKIAAASWALEHDCSVVICNGQQENAITDTINGKQIGTFFSYDENAQESTMSKELLATKAREGGRLLQQLQPEERSAIINDYADRLKANTARIMEANTLDLKLAKENNISGPLLARLVLNEKKIDSLVHGMKQIASNGLDLLGKVLKCTKVTENLILNQITVPLGVLLVIFESRPDSLPQIASLCISSANGLLLKGGSEAFHTNKVLHELVQDSLEAYVPRETISMVNSREDINDLLKLDPKYIDLIIPRGSNDLVKNIQEKSKSIPVLGHAEGVCHVYVDEDADPNMVTKIIRDSKCDYPSACNALETLLIHKNLVNTDIFNSIIEMLEKEKVVLNSGPLFNKLIKFAPPVAKNLKHEYSDLELTIELVENVDAAINHINKYGSSHTESIITNNPDTAAKFMKNIDSACVFHNASTRMADGYRFGLGAEVGVSTGRIHARGPVGVEGLLTTKWLLHGNGETCEEFSNGQIKFIHQHIDPNQINSYTADSYEENNRIINL